MKNISTTTRHYKILQFCNSDSVSTLLQNCQNSIATVCDIFQKLFDWFDHNRFVKSRKMNYSFQKICASIYTVLMSALKSLNTVKTVLSYRLLWQCYNSVATVQSLTTTAKV